MGKAIWDAGRTAEAEHLWAVSLNPELLTDVLEVIRDRIRPARTDIVFLRWIPVPDATGLIKDKVYRARNSSSLRVRVSLVLSLCF